LVEGRARWSLVTFLMKQFSVCVVTYGNNFSDAAERDILKTNVLRLCYDQKRKHKIRVIALGVAPHGKHNVLPKLFAELGPAAVQSFEVFDID
jgi:hypothetical protein